MEVTEENFDECIAELKKESLISVDTETTGLLPYQGDILFAIIMATKRNAFYFNFNEYPEKKPLPDKYMGYLSEKLFSSGNITWVMHNATFDMAMLANEGIEVKGDVHDLEMISRVNYNLHPKHNLAEIAKRLGFEKMELKVRSEKIQHPTLNKSTKKKYFQEVPFEDIYKYGIRDARVTFDCYELLVQQILLEDDTGAENLPKMWTVVDNESDLTKAVFNMEKAGVKVDIAYCHAARSHYSYKMLEAQTEFKQITGEDFKKSPKLFGEIFKDEDLSVRTETDQPKFDKDVMKTFKHPAAQCVRDFSEAKKNVEYFENFIYYADKDDVVHANFNQARTKTGRFSSSNPNMQNLTKPDKYEEVEEEKYPVRRAFIPREGSFFVMLDYDQIEYKILLDMVGDDDIIEKINGGLDVHTATAEGSCIKRSTAKAVNFAILYGSGIAALAKSLGVTESKARQIRESVFGASRNLEPFLHRVARVAQTRGYVFNWLGRRSHFPDKKFAYKAPNALIQGGAADLMKIAMVEIDNFLSKFESRMIMTIHDELVFEIVHDEAHIIEGLMDIMKKAYPSSRLQMTAGVEYSYKSLADKVSGMPLESGYGSQTGDEIQEQSKTDVGVTTKFLDCENPTSIH